MCFWCRVLFFVWLGWVVVSVCIVVIIVWGWIVVFVKL